MEIEQRLCGVVECRVDPLKLLMSPRINCDHSLQPDKADAPKRQVSEQGLLEYWAPGQDGAAVRPHWLMCALGVLLGINECTDA